MKYNRNTTNRKYKRSQKMRRRRITFYLLVALLTGTISYFIYAQISNKVKAAHQETVQTALEPRVFDAPDVEFNGRYGDTFNDIQEVQIVAAEAAGITPLADSDSIYRLILDGQLVKVNDCHYYNTDEAELPYLTPMAKELLDEIGKRYHQKQPHEPQMRLTGCLRTHSSISKLRRRNRNSVPTSCHLYGTTFDISYRYMSVPEKRALAQVLYELQQGGYCYVKYERKQPCFHITVRP